MGNQTCCARDYTKTDAEIFKGLSPSPSLKDSIAFSQTSIMPKANMISESTTYTDLPSLNSATLSRPLKSKSDDDDFAHDSPQNKFSKTMTYMPSLSDDNEIGNTEPVTFRPHKISSLKALKFQDLEISHTSRNKLFQDMIDSGTRAKHLNEHILDLFTRQSDPKTADGISTGARTSPKERDDVCTPGSGFARTCTGFYEERESNLQRRAGETRDTLYATWNSKIYRDTTIMDNGSPTSNSLHGMTPKFIEDLSSFCEFDNV